MILGNHLIGADENYGDDDRIGKMQTDEAGTVDEAHQQSGIILGVVGGGMKAVITTTPSPEDIMLQASANWPMRVKIGKYDRMETASRIGQTKP